MEFSDAKDYIVEKLVRELPRNLYYHGAHHTLDVVKSLNSICRSEGVYGEDYILLLTAAYFHDAGYIYKYEQNEEIGVKMARKSLPEFGYSPEQIDIIGNIIMATSSRIEPVTPLEKIMCDADHDYFGRHDYNKIAVSLRKELMVYSREFEDKEWLAHQIKYLEEKHKYYSPTAIKTREPKKRIQLQKLKAILA
jgi:HD superfamily phosphodiesterase